MSISIHPALAQDLERIARLHKRALPETWNSKLGTNHLVRLYRVVRKWGYVSCARSNEEIVGVVSGIGSLILTMIVEPARQRQGIGRELIAHLRGMRYVYTTVVGEGFYQKMGFVRLWQVGSLIFLCRK